ncbi:PqqD family protein [Prevotella sp.]|uniref:PqqD family protein n=1 Tax=Prevotella sp. TaxID=59823 RepID=UPI003077CBDC
MKTKKGFVLRNVCGENIIVAEGKENIDFTKIISMNETAAYLWKNVEGKEFDSDTLMSLLINEYEVDDTTANKDAKNIAKQWIEAGIAE